MRLVHYSNTLKLVQLKEGEVFFSYNTPIAIELHEKKEGFPDAVLHVLFVADMVLNPETGKVKQSQRHLKELRESFGRHQVVSHQDVLDATNQYFPHMKEVK